MKCPFIRARDGKWNCGRFGKGKCREGMTVLCPWNLEVIRIFSNIILAPVRAIRMKIF